MKDVSEEEIIDKINYMINNWHRSVLEIRIEWIKGLLNLYKNEKEINQEHQKINGELQTKITKLEEENLMLKGMFKKSIN